MVIGFRTFPDGFSFVLLDGDQDEPELIDKGRLTYPKGISQGENFSWLRKQIQEILESNEEIENACIKTIEPVARKKSVERLYAEGVILEVLSSLIGVSCSIRINSQLKRDIKDFTEPARYLKKVLSESDELEELYNPKYNEAALAAISELPS